MSIYAPPRPSICPAGGAHWWLLPPQGQSGVTRCRKCGEYDGTEPERGWPRGKARGPMSETTRAKIRAAWERKRDRTAGLP
jgi:hypothetical protein